MTARAWLHGPGKREGLLLHAEGWCLAVIKFGK